ncbi:beta-1,4 N-acetylgalactosaminyltransferase 2 isoform X2 [Callorhinchus milii]|nr:beta-1,4 N-acetylgalactosaminyltransferase 2 isoform X2 [Callorhinchus milii]|eukprot:gi/632981457/ref/XP_007907602.1/ PREDICTED: beta-1,4 N-acetylgalactosaminyltransferase 2-like isoform X2 [Callorhinchus milii]
MLVASVTFLISLYINNSIILFRTIAPTEKNITSGIILNFNFTPKENLSVLSPYGKHWLYPRKACSCEFGMKSKLLESYFKKKDKVSVKKRRSLEYAHYKKRNELPLKQIIIAEANSPLSYPSQGVEVKPLYSIVIPGLGVHELQREIITVTLKASKGVFNTIVDVPEDSVHGSGEKEMTITSPSLDIVNAILKHVTYTSTVYHINSADLVHFQFEKHLAIFSIAIRQPTLPRLFDPGPANSINSLVTIITKTFYRYHKLQNLINSIRAFYPEIQIIIADDNKYTEKIEGQNIEQYFMPFAKGWFAGRNLAASQVTTKYLLWVDDDFFFTKKTKIEKLVDVLENTTLDLVGASVNGRRFLHKLWYEQGDDDGDCLFLQPGTYQALDGFPNCEITSCVVNFFMARTEKVWSVGFDPRLSRIAHPEFFIDGLGQLSVGSCSDVVIGHQSKGEPSNQTLAGLEKTYKTFRRKSQTIFKKSLYYFKNHLKCIVGRNR